MKEKNAMLGNPPQKNDQLDSKNLKFSLFSQRPWQVIIHKTVKILCVLKQDVALSYAPANCF